MNALLGKKTKITTWKASETAKGDGRKKGRRPFNVAHRILLRPQVTEKAGNVAEHNQYIFRVAGPATKPDIARAVFEAYGIRPLRVTTLRIPGKKRRLGATQGRISGYKKAVVTLPEGKTIEVLPR